MIIDKQKVLDEKMIKVRLNVSYPLLKETLTRIGVLDTKDKILTQQVHCLKRGNDFHLTHFKLLFELNGHESTYSFKDKKRFYTVAKKLKEWNMIEIVSPEQEAIVMSADDSSVRYISAKNKENFSLVSKYNFN